MFAFQILFALPILCWYLIYRLIRSRYYDFWKHLGVPYVSPSFLFGNIKGMIFGKSHISTEYDKIYKSIPDEDRYIGFFEFFRPQLMVKDPQLIEHVLIKDFHLFHSRGITFDERLDPLEAHLANLAGNRWKMVRTKFAPTFSSGKLKQMTGLMKECVDDLDCYLNEYAENERPIDVRETMAKFTTDVIGRCAFGLDFNTLKDSNSEYRKMGKQILSPTVSGIIKNLIGMMNRDILIKLKIKIISKHTEDFFTNLFHSTRAYRKEHSIERNDFMQLMINLHDQEISGRYQLKDEDNDKELEFTDNLLIANIFIFYIAGFETTASALNYTFYELALNPNVQNKLRNEIKETLEKHNGVLTYDVLYEMKYMDMVISESLRKYSPASVTGRECTEEYQLPGTSIIIPAKTKFTIPIYSIHHDPKYYPEPEKFIPERFSDKNIAGRPPHTYLPFGGGPRICIGLRFAKLEMKSCLARIISKYQFDVCKQTIVPIRINPRSLLYAPSHEVVISISKLR